MFTGFIIDVAHVNFRMRIPEFSPCGMVCDYCGWFKGEKMPQCRGCRATECKPFWGTCETCLCAKRHGVEHCGVCSEFPCDDFMSRYDPSEGPENAVFRAGLLAYRAKHGDEKTLELARRIEQE